VLCTAWIVAVERDVKSRLGSMNNTVSLLLMERHGRDSLCSKANASAKSIDPADGPHGD
jgi:hypothetical protein